MPRPLRLRRPARLVLVTTAAVGFVFGAAMSVREEALPSWVPAELGRLTLRTGDASELSVTRDEAVEYARTRLFVVPDAAAEPTPDAFAIRVTGLVPPEQPTPVGSSGRLTLRQVDRKPAWLVVWRGVDRGVVGPQPVRSGEPIDVVCLVDGETGVFLYPCTFLSLGGA